MLNFGTFGKEGTAFAMRAVAKGYGRQPLFDVYGGLNLGYLSYGIGGEDKNQVL